MSSDNASNLGEATYPPDREFLDLLDLQFVRIGSLLLEECRQPVPVPPQLMRDYTEDAFEANIDTLTKELDKGLSGKFQLKLKGPYHSFGHPIAGANSGRAYSFGCSDSIVNLWLYTDTYLEPILYGHVPRDQFLAGDKNEPVTTVFASVEMPPVITDLHELAEATQERIRDGELMGTRRRGSHAVRGLIDYNKKLNDAGAKPHYLDEASQLAIIQMLEVAEPDAGWTLDCNYWVLR